MKNLFIVMAIVSSSAACANAAALLDYRFSASIVRTSAANGGLTNESNLENGEMYGPFRDGLGDVPYDFTNGFLSGNQVASTPAGAQGWANAFGASDLLGGSNFTRFNFASSGVGQATRDANQTNGIGRGFGGGYHRVYFTLDAAHTYELEISGNIAVSRAGVPSDSISSQNEASAGAFLFSITSGYDPITGFDDGRSFIDGSSAVNTNWNNSSAVLFADRAGTLQPGMYMLDIWAVAQTNAKDIDVTTAITNNASASVQGFFDLTPVGGTPTQASTTVSAGSTFNHDFDVQSSDGSPRPVGVQLNNPTGGTLTVTVATADELATLNALAAASLDDVPAAGSDAQIWTIDLDAGGFDSATVTFTYDPALLAPGTDESELRIYHYTGDLWTLPADQLVDIAANTITFTVTDFSPFALGVIPEPASAAVLLALGVAAGVRRRR